MLFPGKGRDGVSTQSGYVDVDNGQIYYESVGDGAEAVVLIHGRAGDRRHWDAQFEAPGDVYRVVRYDVRCFGRSSDPTEDHVYSDRGDLLQLLDALDIDSAHIVGWSMGCEIAVDFVVDNPSRARSLIAVGPWVKGYQSSSPEFEAFMGQFGTFGDVVDEVGPEGATDAWSQLPFWVDTVCDLDAGLKFKKIASEQSWVDWTPASQQHLLEPGALERLSEISLPTLIITAEHDVPACVEVADLLDARVPNSTEVVIAGAGHCMHMEKPDEFNRHVLDFLERIGD